MPRQTPLARFKAILKGRAPAAKKAAIITELAPKLPNAALAVMDEFIGAAEPLVQVAIMDAYFEMTEDAYYEDDLIRILDRAARRKDKGEELYMAARLALGRLKREPMDACLEGEIEIVGIRAPRRRGMAPARRKRIALAVAPETLTLIIHGTWAADGTWWRKGGDFFEYVEKELARHDLYGAPDAFRWSGRNQDKKRREAATSLAGWLKAHPAAAVNAFAHSHGANVAMLATREGARFRNLVMLSPPVRKDYFADWTRVERAFNIQADHDPVVAIAKGGKSFLKAGAKPGTVKEKELKADGHSASHDPEVWRAERLADFVGIPWP